MRGNELLDKMELVDPRYIEEADKPRKIARIPWKVWGAAAACLLLATAASVASYRASHRPTVPIRQTQTASVPPNGPRKTLNYDGGQYVFLENGSTFELTEEHLGEELGRLEYDILADREANADRDYAATFAVGGTLYEMKGYDPRFRVAVEFEGSWYIGERAGHTDGSALDPAALFDAAGFDHNVTEALLLDHFGREELGRLSGEEGKLLVELLDQVAPATLTREDYEAIGKAQNGGESFQVVFQLADTTCYKLYVIPSLSVAMIGNGRYTLTEEFHSAFDPVFDSLVQTPVERISH